MTVRGGEARVMAVLVESDSWQKVVQRAPRACPNLIYVLRLVYLENLDDSKYYHRSQPKENT
jgi:hypothetical protein